MTHIVRLLLFSTPIILAPLGVLAGAQQATVVIPPARTANVSGHGLRSAARDRTITWV